MSAQSLMHDDKRRVAKLIIIGTGFGGLIAAMRMKQGRDDDFIVLERADDVGGVWRDNHYPGCACDVQSHLYSMSFAPNPDWSREFSRQPEIHAYLQRCAREAGVLPQVRFSTEVRRMTWDEGAAEWAIMTSRGEYRARYVVGAMGSLSDPIIPNLQGLDGFLGRAFHSAAWPSGFDLKGKSVAVIGTGASAIQFIPAIQPQVGKMHVFQRTAPWVLERHDFAINPLWQERYRRFPWLQKLARGKIYLQREWLAFGFRNPVIMRFVQRGAIKHMNRAVTNPELRRKLTPEFTLGCKRVLISNDYYPAMAQPNVDVVTTGIERITPKGVMGTDGVERRVDAIIFGTGFQVKDLPYSHCVYGRNGRSLAQAWAGSPKSLAGTTVNGFPNLFLMHGPNTGLGHSSVIYMLEAQVEHALSVMRHAEQRGEAIIEARAEAQQQFTSWIDRNMRGTVWTSGGCDSWYLDNTGRNSSLWPSYTFTFRNRVAMIRADEYDVRSPLGAVVA